MAHWSDRLSRVKHPDGRILIGASFRGVPFFVESHDYTGGRRQSTHEFAENDLPAHDDRGRRARVFSVTGYVLGSGYIAQRDSLLSALEDVGGPGELIHPYLGPKRVVVGGISLRESVDDGGIARFQIEFKDAPLAVSPTVVQDLTAGVASASDVAAVAIQAQFEETYDVDGQPTFATESLQSQLSLLGESVGDGLTPLAATTEELARLDVDVQGLSDDAATLVRSPANVINALTNIFLQLTETLSDAPKEVIEALLDTYDLDPIANVIGSTATRIQERANQLALSDALRAAIVVQCAKLVVDVEFLTTGDATSLRNRIVSALDALATTAGDTAYPAIQDLRSSVLRAVPGDAVLASIRTIHRNVDVPALVLSHSLYGDTDLAQDIVDRNGVQHPAFVVGDIEVLTFG